MNKDYKKKKHVFVAMSGGVDSSVAASLLKDQGYKVTGVFMRCYNVDGCAERDAEDARRVAEKLDIPFYVWDFEVEYKKKVVDYMVDGYRRGITPNPDVMCNREIKFGLFLDRALSVGADYVATGHYVSLRNLAGTGDPLAQGLFEAKDKNKDQSYFLWTLTQDKLLHCLFPIGDYLKSEVRDMARKAGLPTAEKKDSQGICFLGKVSLVDFLRDYIPEKIGDVVTVSGEKIGEHKGAYFYTVGQRHGLDLKEKNSALGLKEKHETLAHYIAAKDTKTNKVVVAEGRDNEALYKREAMIGGVNFVSPDFKSRILTGGGVKGLEVFARVRYRQPLAKASLQTKGDDLELVFDKAQKFVAPGQSAVFYSDSGEMLGGGVIG